jgi:sulfur-carrier protein
MEITCQLFGPLREVAGEKTVGVELGEENTVEEALRALCEEHPELRKRLFEGEEVDFSGVTVTRNGKHVTQEDGGETRVEAGDTLRLAPPVIGGSGQSAFAYSATCSPGTVPSSFQPRSS